MDALEAEVKRLREALRASDERHAREIAQLKAVVSEMWVRGGFAKAKAKEAAKGPDAAPAKDAPAPAPAKDASAPPSAPAKDTAASAAPAQAPPKEERLQPKQDPDMTPAYSASFMEVLRMMQAGETPPDIREIDDAPKNPAQPLPASNKSRAKKPWEK